jgi:hypothetical protein
VQTLSAQLTAEFGNGFSKYSLSRMMSFTARFPDERIVAALSRQLSWSHFVELIPLEDSLKRDFYTEICHVERWSVRTLRHKIGHLLYERTAVSEKPDSLIAKDIATLRNQDRNPNEKTFAHLPHPARRANQCGHHAPREESRIAIIPRSFQLPAEVSFNSAILAVEREGYRMALTLAIQVL